MANDNDRILVVTDILLGAAYADDHLAGREKSKIKELLSDLVDGELPGDVVDRIDEFPADKFDLAATVKAFAEDPLINKHNLLELVVAVNDADEVTDLAEDQFLHDLAAALDIPAEDYDDLALDYEVEELKETLACVRTPPPLPGIEFDDDDAVVEVEEVVEGDDDDDNDDNDDDDGVDVDLG